MAGLSHVGRSSVLVLYFTMTNMERLFSNNMPGFMGEAVLLLTCLSLQAAAGNSMPENRQSRSSPKKLPAAFTEQEVWLLHQKYTQTFSFKEHVIFPFPTCQACAWKEKACPPYLPLLLRMFPASPSVSVLFAGVRNMVPGVNAEKIGCQIQQHL